MAWRRRRDTHSGAPSARSTSVPSASVPSVTRPAGVGYQGYPGYAPASLGSPSPVDDPVITAIGGSPRAPVGPR
jgi:hypothetical protein